MLWTMYIMYAVCFIVIIFAIVVFSKQRNVRTTAGAYDVFEIREDGQLVVLAGIPVYYNIIDIDKIRFKKSRNRSQWMGWFRIIKRNGKKSRPFSFDSSVIKKKMVWINSSEDIEQATAYIVNQLREHGIVCESK